MMKLQPDFLEFLRLLQKHNVRYLLVGGYAVGYHGYPRMTMDMNIWVDISPHNASHIIEALKEFGFNTPELEESLFLKHNTIIRMGIKPQMIEILTSISGVTFNECYNNRILESIHETEVAIISLDDLKKNKRAASRPKDMADLEYI